jgi:membrane-bound hydrogenase subunit ehaF
MIIRRISGILSNFTNLSRVYAILVIIVVLAGIAGIPSLDYQGDRLYPKTIDRDSPLDPYDRGGIPFESTAILAEYPGNSPYLGYITAYLTPLSLALASATPHMGTTIVAHPGGIIDEILYATRGLDTVVETTILFVGFAVAAYLFRRREEE